jgi:hypothetical protein
MSYDNPRLGRNLVVYRENVSGLTTGNILLGLERLGIDGEGFKNDRQLPGQERTFTSRFWAVESRCGAVVVGSVCLLPPLSFGGAQVTSP